MHLLAVRADREPRAERSARESGQRGRQRRGLGGWTNVHIPLDGHGTSAAFIGGGVVFADARHACRPQDLPSQLEVARAEVRLDVVLADGSGHILAQSRGSEAGDLAQPAPVRAQPGKARRAANVGDGGADADPLEHLKRARHRHGSLGAVAILQVRVDQHAAHALAGTVGE